MKNKVQNEEAQFEALIQGLIDNNYSYCNDFISPNIVNGLRDKLNQLYTSGKLKESGIGNNSDLQIDKTFRGDKIHWINVHSINEFELLYNAKINRFITYLNKTCFTSILSFESHYASYETESFYKRHIDQFKSEKGRKFSIVLYLNEDWKAEDAGLLSLYPKDLAQIDISPLGGRLVLFRSDEMEHEVHASFTRERRSIAAWLKN